MDVIKLYICYDQKDKDLKSQLLQHLSWLIRIGQVTSWDDSMILPGVNWKQETNYHLKTSDIILLLISPNFISSDKSIEEMQTAFQRHEAKEAHIIPIILRPTDWRETLLGKLQVLPTNGKPVVEWRDRDQAFQDVVQGIARVITSLYKAKATPPIQFPEPKVKPPPLTTSEIENGLQKLPGWKARPVHVPGDKTINGTEIVKTYQFRNYDVAFGFINKASEHAAAVPHHPSWEITWGTVTVRLTTYDIKHKLSHYDFEMAEYLDKLSGEYPPPRDKK